MENNNNWYTNRSSEFYSVPKTYDKPHKFFERHLDNDLEKMYRFLKHEYKGIEKAELRGVSPLHDQDVLWLDSGSISTIKWKEYNVFQFYSDELYNLLLNIKDAVMEACDYYGIDFYKEKYYVQGWFNINNKDAGKLDWHDHGGPWAPFFHGYYCINAEPSSTYYKINNDDNQIFENVNKNNRLIVSEMGHPHAMGEWNWEGDRVTVAYDITPLRFIRAFNQPQHWIPLV